MLTTVLDHQVTLQSCEVTNTPVGIVKVWSTVGTYYCRRIPLDTKTIAAYQQNSTVVTDKYIFKSGLTISLGVHRIVDGDNTYEPAATAMQMDDATVVLVRKL